MAAPAKTRLGKNKKKAWRKVDITDIEEFLEDERLQERTGGLVAEKANDQLFVLDKQAADTDTDVPRKRRRREPKPLKCHSSLIIDPKIKAARVPHNVRQESIERRHKNVVERIKSGKRTEKEKKAAEQRKSSIQQRRKKWRETSKIAKFDLWEDGNTQTNNTKRNRSIKAPSLLQKPSEIPAVEVPHPGASYNPAYDDYQELIWKAHSVEVKKDRIERKLHKAVDVKIPKVQESVLQEAWLSEMSAGIAADDNDKGEEGSDDDDDDGDVDRLSVNPPVRRESKKTKTQRNKEKKIKQQEKRKEKEKAGKVIENEIFRLKKIKADIKRKELQAKKKKELGEEKLKSRGLETRKLGKVKYEEPEIEIKLTDELEGSLRRLKPEGNLLTDRYKRLQKRNMIEPRVQAKKYRRYKIKRVEKRGHRNITL